MSMRKMEKFLSLMLCLVLAAAPALAQGAEALDGGGLRGLPGARGEAGGLV